MTLLSLHENMEAGIRQEKSNKRAKEQKSGASEHK